MNSTRLAITYIGGPTALVEFGGVRLLTDPTFDPAGGEYPSGAATLRKLIHAGTRIVGMSYEAGDDVEQVVEDAERTLFEVTNERVAENFHPLNELLMTGWDHIAELSERKQHITGVPTGVLKTAENCASSLSGKNSVPSLRASKSSSNSRRCKPRCRSAPRCSGRSWGAKS